jgi:hypothetical protein
MNITRVDLLGAVEKVVELLVNNEFEALSALTNGIRLDSTQMSEAISSYGRNLVMPPTGAYMSMDAIEVTGAKPRKWSVVMPLWTREEGRSDLAVELTLVERVGHWDVELDDIRVR